ncbi:MAG: response regulator [Burkholderiales bacterium]|nr:response regulator [Burkholderiales bacterium]
MRVATPDGAHLRLVGAIGLPPEVERREQYVPFTCGICGKAAREQSVEICEASETCRETTALGYFGDRCRRVIAVPLRHRGRVMGVYNLFMAADAPVPPEVSLLFTSISEHLGMALENARLARENIRATLVNERQMLANEVHDSLAQTLAYIKMRLAFLSEAIRAGDDPLAQKYLADVEQGMDSAYGRLRELLTHFRDRMDPRGLVPALRDLVDGFGAQTGIRAEFHNRGPEPELTPEQELHVYHVVQEALTNAAKHARARNVTVEMDFVGNEHVVTVQDDGTGIGAGHDPPLRHAVRPLDHARARRAAGRRGVGHGQRRRGHAGGTPVPGADCATGSPRMNAPIRVVLVDDHTLFRKGLAELLEHGGTVQVVGVTGDPDDARRLLREQRPDVAIVDLHMPARDGLALLREFRNEGIDVPTLFLTVSNAESDLAAALRAGARGYLLKDMEPDEVVDAVQRAARGETVVAPAMTAKLVNLLDGKRNTPESLLNQLTSREREILSHLAQGQSNKVIARALSISQDTVKLHVRHVLAKLNLSSRVEAAVFAVERKLAGSRKE